MQGKHKKRDTELYWQPFDALGKIRRAAEVKKDFPFIDERRFIP